MIVVRVELLSAITGHTTELARMEICNEGTNPDTRRGDYTARTLRGRSAKQLASRTTQRQTVVNNWPRLSQHVWNLVAVSLAGMGYGGNER